MYASAGSRSCHRSRSDRLPDHRKRSVLLLQRGRTMRAAVYARVSTLDQEPENKRHEIGRSAQARAWTSVEYVDRGVSGAKDRRPALDQLIADAQRRRFDVVVCWR